MVGVWVARCARRPCGQRPCPFCGVGRVFPWLWARWPGCGNPQGVPVVPPGDSRGPTMGGGGVQGEGHARGGLAPKGPCGAPRNPCGAPSSWRAPSPKGPRSFGTHPPRLRHGTQGGHKKGPRLVATSKTCKGAAPLHNPLAHTPKGAPSGSPWGIPPGPPAARLLLVAVAAAPGCLSVTPRGVGVSEGGLGRPPSEGFPVWVFSLLCCALGWVAVGLRSSRLPTPAFPLQVGWACVCATVCCTCGGWG